MAFLLFLQELQNPVLDGVFNGLTLLFSEYVMLFAACWCLWCYNKDLGYQLGFSFFISGMVNQILKVLFKVPRPWVQNPALQPGDIALKSATGYSFPSGHTQLAASGLGSIALYFKRNRLTALCLCTLALVAFSRLYLGVHTPKDVLVSLVIGLLFAWLVGRAYPLLQRRPKGVLAFCILLALLGILPVSIGPQPAYSLIGDNFQVAGALLGYGLGWYTEITRIRCPKAAKRPWRRFAVGMVLVACLHLVCGLVFEDVPAWDVVRYALVMFAITAGMPWLFKQFRL